MNKTICKNKMIGVVSNVGLLALIVGVNPPAYGQDTSEKEKKAYQSEYKSSRVDEVFNRDDKADDRRSAATTRFPKEDKMAKREQKEWHKEYKSSRVNELFEKDEDEWSDEHEMDARLTSPTPTFTDTGNEATRHIDRMVAILGEMEKALGDAARTASLQQNNSNVAGETRTEQPTGAQQQPARATDTEQPVKPESPMMEESQEAAPADSDASNVPEDIIGMPQEPGRIPERLAQPPMTNLPSNDLANPMDVIEPSDVEDRPVPTVPNEVPPRIIEEESIPSQPSNSDEMLEDADEPNQPEDSEEMLPEMYESRDADGEYIPPQR